MNRPGFKFALLVSILMITAVTAFGAENSPGTPEPKKWSFEKVGTIPIQAGGRVKPLDSFARETVLLITGSRSLPGWNPVDLLFSWMSHPDQWNRQAFIKVSNKQLIRQLLMDEQKSRFAPEDLAHNQVLIQYAQEVMQQGAGVKPNQVVQSVNSQQNPREQELKRVLDRLGIFRALISGTALTLVPGADLNSPWSSLADGDPSKHPTKLGFLQMLKAYYEDKPEQFAIEVDRYLKLAQENVFPKSSVSQQLLSLEVTYNRSRPFLWACVFYLLAGLLWILSSLEGKLGRIFHRVGIASAAFAFIVHVVGFAIRIRISGRPPVSNMYESIVWVAFGAFVFGVVIYWIHRYRAALSAGAIMAGLGLIAADSSPAVMDPGIHPLVPVLRSNLWLTIHVLTITLGYAAFMLSLGLANAALYQYLKLAFQKQRSANPTIVKLNEIMYRALQFGVVLLAAGTILGGVWADYSWGRFWGWDPKETWALIALLTYLAVLHARFTGWVGQFAFSVWTALSFVSVVMAWYGVNFILGVGLHSYGFSSGQGMTVPLLIALQIAFVGFVALMRGQMRGRAKSK